MNLFNLVGKLVLDSQEYEQGIDQAKDKNQEFEQSTSNTSAVAAAKWAAVAAAVMKVISVIKNLVVDSTQYADNIKNMAQIYGYTTQEIQEMNSVAEQSGKSLERVLRGIQSSGQTAAEYLGLTAEEYQDMVDQAYQYGTILSDEALNRVDALGDRVTYLKAQWRAAITALLSGEEGSEEAVAQFFENLKDIVERYSPMIIQFAVKLLITVAKGLVKVLPEIVEELVATLVEEVYSVNWYKVGWDIQVAIFKGFWNGMKNLGKKLLKKLGIDIGDNDELETVSDADITSKDYAVTESSTQKIDVTVKAEGDTPISEMNAELVGGAIAEQIDDILGRRLNG